jgi:hypothetical protein
LVKAVLTVADWLAPEDTAMVEGRPAVLVSEKLTGLGVVPAEVAAAL